MNCISNFSDFSQALMENQAVEEINQLNNEIESLDEGVVKQVLGWLFFTPYSLINVAIQYTKKKKIIQANLAKEKDPAKKEKMRAELEAISYEEVKQREKIKRKEKELKDKAREAKKDMTPQEKEKFDKEKEKMEKKLEKAKEQLRKLEDSSDFAKGFV